jgi:hypothetical protein
MFSELKGWVHARAASSFSPQFKAEAMQMAVGPRPGIRTPHRVVAADGGFVHVCRFMSE